LTRRLVMVFSCGMDKELIWHENELKHVSKRKQNAILRKARKQERRERLQNVFLESVYRGDDFFTVSLERVSSEMEDEMRNNLQNVGAVYFRCKHTFLNQIMKKALKAAPLDVASVLNSLIAMNSGQVALVISPKGTDVFAAIQAVLDTSVHYIRPKVGMEHPEGEYFIIKAGPTGIDPSIGCNFSANDIPTKINRGQIDIYCDVCLARPGTIWKRYMIELIDGLHLRHIIPVHAKVCNVLISGRLFTYEEFRPIMQQLRYGIQQTIFEAAALAYSTFQNMETAFPGLREEIDFNIIIQDINDFTVGTELFDFLSLQVSYWHENKGSVFNAVKETMI